MNLLDILGLIVQDAFWSALAAMGFAILFNVPRRALPFCMIAGATGHATRTLFMQQFGFGIEPATLIGATVVGFLAKAFARRLKMPSMVFAVSAVIPMVPGTFAYGAMIGILELAATTPENAGPIIAEVVVNGVKTGLILIALAAGITAPILLFQRHKPVV